MVKFYNRLQTFKTHIYESINKKKNCFAGHRLWPVLTTSVLVINALQ